MCTTSLSHGVLALTLAGCTTPGARVAVPTMSVEQAWTTGRTVEVAPVAARVIDAGGAPTRPQPLMSAPQVRLAYIKPWTDAAGNRHYGSWIALPVDAPQWVLPDGTLPPVDTTRPQSHPAPAAR